MNTSLDFHLLESLFYQSQEGLLLVDTQSNRLLKTNHSFNRMVGFTENELIGKKFNELIEYCTNDSNRVAEINLSLSDLWCPAILHLNNCTRFPIHIQTRYHNPQSNQALFVVRRVDNATNPPSSEIKIDSFARQLLLHVHEGVILYDLELRYRFWNRFMETISGYSEQEVLGQRPWELFPFLASQGLRENLTRALEGERVAIAEIWVDYPRTGIKGWVSANYSPVYDTNQNIIGVITTLRDHTKQKLSAEAVEKSEERYRALIENGTEGTTILNTDGKIIYQSPTNSRIIGFTADQVKGQSVFSFIYPDDIPEVQEKFNEILKQPNSINEITTRLIHKDGGYVWIEGTAHNQINNPVINGIVVNWRDVTRRRIAEAQVQARLNELSLLHEIGQLASSAQTEFELLSSVTNLLSQRLSTDDCGFLLLDSKTQKLTVHSSYVYRIPREPEFSFPFDRGITGEVIRTGRSIREGDIRGNPLYIELNPNTRSELCAPLWVDGAIAGVFNLESSQLNAYNQTEELILSTILNLVGNTLARLRLQKQLENQKQFFSKIIQTAAEGICVCTGRSEYPFIRFQIWNDQMVILTGYTQEEINRLGWYQTMYPEPESQQRSIERMERMRQGEDLRAEVWIITRKDGQKRDFMISTSSVEIEAGEVATVAIMQDITEQKQAQIQLYRSEQMLRLILNSIPQGVFWKDRQSRYLGCNQVVAKAFGFSSENELLGKDDSSISCLREDQVKYFLQKDREVIESGIPEFGILEQATLANQTTIWMETNKIPIRNENNEIVGVLGTWQDVTERQKVALALKKSEERYRAFITQSTEGIWLFQLDVPVSIMLPIEQQIDWFFKHAYLEECNDTFAKMYGYQKASEVHGARLSQFMSREDPLNIEFFRSFILAGYQIADIESNEYDRFGNERVIVNSMVGHIQDGKLHYAWGMQRDITERKKAERQVVESERKLSAIASTIPQGLYVYDLRQQQFVYSNRELWRNLGHTNPDPIVSVPDWMKELTHPDDLKKLHRLKEWDEVLDNQILESEYRLRHQNGEWRWFQSRETVYKRDSSGRVIQIIGTIQDITQRKESETQLRRSEENLSVAQKIGHIGSWEWNLITGDVYFSEQQFRQLGLEPTGPIPTFEEFIQRIHPEDRARIQEDIQLAKQKGGLFNHEIRYVLPDGKQKWLYGRGSVLLDESGQPWKIMGISQDITDRKRAEEEQRRLELKLQQTQKLESLGVLAGGIAHDFNNLLTSILGYADLALDELPEGSSARDFVMEMINGAHQAAELTRQMLAYSGKGRFKVEALNLSSLVESLSRLLQISISKKCSIRTQLDPNLPAIEGDATQIKQIIMNLVINASEAIGDNTGLISITTGVKYFDLATLADYPLNDGLQEGEYVFLEVADTGCGMSEETRTKIFDPFFTTKFTGRGLGLSAVLGIVRGHQGAIKCTSELGKGTTFQVIFPVSHLTYVPSQKQNLNLLNNDWKGSGLILVVDDEATVRNLAKTMFEKMGFQVELAHDGIAGIEQFRTHVSQIRLVLLDLTMPNLDGEQTFRELFAINPKIPIILSSGYSNQINQERFSHYGFAGFIQKPFRYEELRELVKKALAHSSIQ